MENYLVYFRELNIWSMMLRIVLAMFVGGILGFDREVKRRPAGFRTFMLVSMGAATTMILSQYLDMMFSSFWLDSYQKVGTRTDVVRFGAQVISGIGFIGTGTILLTKHRAVKGLTTASDLWAAACMGIAVGAGFYECVLVGLILIVICMKLLRSVEQTILSSSRNMYIYIEMDSVQYVGSAVNIMKSMGIELFDVDMRRETNAQNIQKINVTFNLRLPKRQPHTDVLAALSKLDGLGAIQEV